MAGLLEMLSPNAVQSPLYKAFDKNRYTLSNMLLGGVGRQGAQRLQGMGQGLMAANQVNQQLAEQRAKEAEAQARLQKAVEFMRGVSPNYAGAVEAGVLAPEDAYKTYLNANKPGGGVSYGKSPIWGTDAEGNNVLGTIGDDGSFKQIDTGGFNPARGVEKIDAGTHWILYDKSTGQQIGTQPKNVYEENRQAALGSGEGKSQSEATAAYKSLQSKLPGLEAVVADLDKVAETATYTYGGQAVDFGRTQLGMEPSEGALARTEYIAKVDNVILPLLRDTFGAAFTVKEGETLRATLGDPNKTPQEKQVVLKAFIEQKKRDVEALASQAGQGTPATGVDALIDKYAD